MNIERMAQILEECCTQFRKGPMVVEGRIGAVRTVDIYAMEAVENAPASMEKVDVEFLVIGVDREKAMARKAELCDLLKEYPDLNRLAEGPGYIEVGGALGSQDLALQLFAVGKVMGMWEVITPAKMGFEGTEAREMAGLGFLMITGWRKAAS